MTKKLSVNNKIIYLKSNALNINLSLQDQHDATKFILYKHDASIFR